MLTEIGDKLKELSYFLISYAIDWYAIGLGKWYFQFTFLKKVINIMSVYDLNPNSNPKKPLFPFKRGETEVSII